MPLAQVEYYTVLVQCHIIILIHRSIINLGYFCFSSTIIIGKLVDRKARVIRFDSYIGELRTNFEGGGIALWHEKITVAIEFWSIDDVAWYFLKMTLETYEFCVIDFYHWKIYRFIMVVNIHVSFDDPWQLLRTCLCPLVVWTM